MEEGFDDLVSGCETGEVRCLGKGERTIRSGPRL